MHGNQLLAPEARQHVCDHLARAVAVLREIRVADRHEDFVSMTNGHVHVQTGPLHAFDVFCFRVWEPGHRELALVHPIDDQGDHAWDHTRPAALSANPGFGPDRPVDVAVRPLCRFVRFPAARLARALASIIMYCAEHDFVMRASGALCVLAAHPKCQALSPIFPSDSGEVHVGARHCRVLAAEGTPHVPHSARRKVPPFPARAWCTATQAQRAQVNAITLGAVFVFVFFQGASTPSTFSGRYSASVS